MDMDARGLIADFTDAASVAGLHAAHIDHERLTAPHQQEPARRVWRRVRVHTRGVVGPVRGGRRAGTEGRAGRA